MKPKERGIIKTGVVSNPKGKRENLIPLTERDPEEARAIRAKGGPAAAAARKKRLTFAEGIRIALEKEGVQDNVIAAMVKAAAEGNVQAFLALRDTIGEKPVEKAEVTTTIEGTLEDRRKEVLERLRCSD